LHATGALTGVAIHAIVAEPGGDAEIVARLTARDVRDLQFKVHSDPDHKLLVRLKASPQNEAPVFVKETMKCEHFDSGTAVPYKNYSMVQPALVVAHKSGRIQQVWSWKTEPAIKDMESLKPMASVPGYGILVGVRPDSDDIIPSIKEDRSVKPSYQGLRKILVEKEGMAKITVLVSVVVGVVTIAGTAFYRYFR